MERKSLHTGNLTKRQDCVFRKKITSNSDSRISISFLFFILATICFSLSGTEKTRAKTVKLNFGPGINFRTAYHKVNSANTRFLDFSYVPHNSILKPSSPWGFQNKLRGRPNVCNQYPDSLASYGIVTGKDRFSIRLPNGPAEVLLFIGSPNYWRLKPESVKVDGKTVYSKNLSDYKAVLAEWTKGENIIYDPKVSFWDRCVAPMVEEVRFPVQVKNGLLTLEMENLPLVGLVVSCDGKMDQLQQEIRAERQKQCRERIGWNPQKDEPMPRVTAKDRQHGYILFSSNVNDKIYPWSRPKNHECTDNLSFFAARNEREYLRIGLLPLKPMKGLEIKVGDLISKSGKKISIPGSGRLWRERYMEGDLFSPVGGKGKSSRAYDPLSSVMLPVEPINVPAGVPRMYTLYVRVPADAEVGLYNAALEVRSEGRKIGSGTVTLQVMPFSLEDNIVTGSIEYHQAFQTLPTMPFMWVIKDRKEKRRLIEAGLDLFKELGFNYDFFAFPPETWGHITGELGNRKFEQTEQEAEQLDWWIKALMKRGNCSKYIVFQMGWPFFVQNGWKDFPKSVTKLGVGKASDPPEVRKKYQKDYCTIVRTLIEIFRKNNYPEIYFYVQGEPDNYGVLGVKETCEIAKLVRQAGGKTLCTINGAFAHRMSPPLFDIVSANHATPIDQELMDSIRKHGHRYGGHNIGLTRFSAGWCMWAFDACRNFVEVFGYTYLLQPYVYLPWNCRSAAFYPSSRNPGEHIPNVNLLALQCGQDDYRYLRKLESLLETCRKTGLEKSAAYQDGKAFLARMKKAYSLDADCFIPMKDPKEGVVLLRPPYNSTLRLERYRQLMASMICACEKELKR